MQLPFVNQLLWPDRTVAAFRLLVVAAQAATILITWPLWQIRQSPPLLPLAGHFQFDTGPWLLVSLAVLIVRPKCGLIAHGILLAIAMLLDQTRIQPQLISQSLLLLGTLGLPGPQLIARVHLISLWFYAAAHKLPSPRYWDDVVPWFWEGIVPSNAHFWLIALGALMAGTEIVLALLSVLPRTRRAAAILAGLFHSGALVMLMLRDWNPSVWPWNASLAAAGIALVAPWKTSLWADIRASRLLTRLVVTLLVVTPAGYYFALVDPYLCHCLYAGNTPRAFLHGADGEHVKLDYLPEVNVPLPPAHRVYEQYFALATGPGESLEIQDPRWWAARQGWDRRMLTHSGEYRQGLRHGDWIFRHPNGRPLSAGAYMAGKQTGRWTFWYDDGRQEAAGRFVDNEMDGPWTFWTEDGRELKATYRRGERVEPGT